MSKVFTGCIVAAFALALAAPASAATETVKGKIVDQTCYTKDMKSNAGKDHKMPAETVDCATACARKGAPLALLTDDGKLYQITGGLAADGPEANSPAGRVHHARARVHDRYRDPLRLAVRASEQRRYGPQASRRAPF